MADTPLRLVTNPELTVACAAAHKGAAGFLAALLVFEDNSKHTYDDARVLERWASGLVDIAEVIVKLAEKEEHK